MAWAKSMKIGQPLSPEQQETVGRWDEQVAFNWLMIVSKAIKKENASGAAPKQSQGASNRVQSESLNSGRSKDAEDLDGMTLIGESLINPSIAIATLAMYLEYSTSENGGQ